MDFYRIKVTEQKDGSLRVYPDWVIDDSVKDLLVYQGGFQAVWDEGAQLWSTSEYDLRRLVDADIREFASKIPGERVLDVRYLRESSSGSWDSYQKFLRTIPENRRDLNTRVAFENTELKKEDYATFRLPYPILEGSISAYEELVATLYSPEERAKLEWAIGAIISGASVDIQKFIVLYGKPGSGKSTILNIIEMLFDGYCTVFNAKELTSNSNEFALAPFAHNPLVGVQQDGDLSKIEDSTQLNSITSHDRVTINRKYMQPYTIKAKTFLFMASNEPVKIRNAKAGIIRRLIDVTPTGELVQVDRYHALMKQVEFELGAIAHHCLEVFNSMGADYYADYRPRKMQEYTDFFYNFIESIHPILKRENGMTLKQGWALYKEYCDENNVRALPQYKFRAEFENYFEERIAKKTVAGVTLRNYYYGYKSILAKEDEVEELPYEIELNPPDDKANPSSFDVLYSEAPAQYADDEGKPGKKWENVSTTLEAIDTKRLHWVQVPEHHIIIDFDLVDEDGEKDLERNIQEASKWPPTYTEVSQSGKAIHLHYLYNGKVEELANVFDVGIEVKVYKGNSSLRRRLTKCNDLPIETISSGLPKKEKKVISTDRIQTEKGLRALIERNLRKEIHPGTKPSVDFIVKILEDAYNDGLSYDVRDLRPAIIAFAANSTNHSAECIKMTQTMKYVGKENMPPPENLDDAPILFFDIEVYPNLFVLCWKRDGDEQVTEMVNPSPHEVEPLLSQKLVGFNNRRYDNHILYARYLGYSNEELYKLSTGLIKGNRSAYFGEAYNLSWADIYDFSSVKQGLKKFEIALGLYHLEMDIPWDEPVPDDRVQDVIDYCKNDVLATEAVFHSRHADYVAREILADISGLTVNHTTQAHTARILFGTDKEPQSKFVYTDLSGMFPGYNFTGKESQYKDEVVGEGGYVYAEPGVYENVALLDIASMHPTSIIKLNLFGPYTERFEELVEARLAIKQGRLDDASKMLDGKLAEHIEEDSADDLAYALKIVINIVYGLTSAKFDNPFRDLRNRDNIVAKRGALFMVDLKHALQERGVQVCHIKTDSVKIPNATEEDIEFVKAFGQDYGYTFEHEATYAKFALVNDAVYVAKAGDKWTAVGKQFQHPYVYKTLFSGESPTFEDFCEVKSVMKGTIYYDRQGLDTSEEDAFKRMVHVGRVAVLVPVRHDGGNFWRVNEGKYYALPGTKGYMWVPRDIALAREADGDLQIDMDYFEQLAEEARAAISKFQLFDQFIGDE